MKTRAKQVFSRQILDSRGHPAVEVDVRLDDDGEGRASAPSGAPTGRHEALERRDGDNADYAGLGIRKTVENIGWIRSAVIIGRGALDQVALDHHLRALDGAPNRSRLAANAILIPSLEICTCS